MRLIDLCLEAVRERERALRRLDESLREIKAIAQRFDPSARAFLFGSLVEGRAGPSSDVDVLIVSGRFASLEDRVGLFVELRRRFKWPFEFHPVNSEELRWHARFARRLVEV